MFSRASLPLKCARVRAFVLLACVCLILPAAARPAFAASVIFQDGFESGSFGAAWTTSATNAGRSTVTSEFAPASGNNHLVLDDGLDDATNSVAEATLQLDLSYKRNVVLTFAAKSLGNEPNNILSTRSTAEITGEGRR